MLSMKRMRCGSFCMISELVRTPSPKKRTPFISVPSVTPVGGEDDVDCPGARSFDAVDPLEVGDRPSRGSALRARASSRRGARRSPPFRHRIAAAREHAFRRAAGAHHAHGRRCRRRRRRCRPRGRRRRSAGCAHRSRECRRSASRGAARSSTITTRSSTVRPSASRDRAQVLIAPARRGRRRPSSSGRRRASPCRGRARAARPPRDGRRQNGDGVGRAGRAQVRAFERIDRDVDLREARWPRHCAIARAMPTFSPMKQHRRLVALALADDDRAVDRHGSP